MKEDPKWKQVESEANRLLGLSGTSGSGNQKGDGDGRNSQYIHECKHRTSGSHSIPKVEWTKLAKAADKFNSIPIFTTFREGDSEMLSTMRTKDLGSLMGAGSANQMQIDRIYDIADRTLGTFLRRTNANVADKLLVEFYKLLESELLNE